MVRSSKTEIIIDGPLVDGRLVGELVISGGGFNELSLVV
jgi:hypothetical protein